jgi:1-acyl-sn-glycerol-3-phosphate acyltransferase
MKTLLLILARGVLRVAFGLYRTPTLPTPCIVVSNHNTHFDVYVLSMLFAWRALPRVRSVAAADTFERGLAGAVSRATLNLILVDRRARTHDPLEEVRRALARGDSLIIFPEGTRGEPGVIAPFKAGIGELAASFPQVPIYPCFIAGIERVWPRGSRLPLPFNVEVLVGEPCRPDPALHRREIAALLEARVRALAVQYDDARRGDAPAQGVRSAIDP